jgi:hypothetical protein
LNFLPYNKGRPNSHFPQINRADRSYLLRLPCLDPYRDQRGGGWLGSLDVKDRSQDAAIAMDVCLLQ